MCGYLGFGEGSSRAGSPDCVERNWEASCEPRSGWEVPEGGGRQAKGSGAELASVSHLPGAHWERRSLDPREKSVGRGAVTPILRVRTLKPQVSDVPKLPRNRVAELGFRWNLTHSFVSLPGPPTLGWHWRAALEPF